MKNQGGYVGNAENQGRKLGNGGGNAGNQVRNARRWGRSKGVGMEIKHKRSGEK